MNYQDELIKFVSEIDDGVFFIDANGYFTFSNEGWKNITFFQKKNCWVKIGGCCLDLPSWATDQVAS